MMTARVPAFLPLAAAICLALGLGSCLQEGPSTETGNPNLRGTQIDAQGRPAPGVVKLFLLPAAAAPGAGDTRPPIGPRLLDSVIVGTNGGYRFDGLAAGTYALEGRDRAQAAFALVGGLVISAPGDTLLRDLPLAPPGRITGRVTRGPNARPAGIRGDEKILVRLADADRSTETDTAGLFSLEKVPAGTYRLAFAAEDGHYLTRYLDGVAVASGTETKLPLVELEWSQYGEPPAVAGLRIAIDSSAGIARLSWRAVPLSGGASVLYAVTRDGVEIHRGPDTVFVDTLAGIAAGTPIRYAVQAINPLGQAGPADTAASLAPGPGAPPDGEGVLEGAVLQGNSPVTGARVALYLIPSAAGSPDSLPLGVRLLDSATSDAAGRYRFDRLGAAKYTVVARVLSGTDIGMAMGLAPRNAGARLDTLRPAATGVVAGAASRDSLWITSPFKGDENIRVGLAGTPFTGLTDYGSPPAGGAFRLNGIPAGSYTLVVYAVPEGYFLPDSLPIIVRAGDTARVPTVVKARYNPMAPPPRIASLRLAGATRDRINLSWDPVTRYPLLAGYRVLRLSPERVALDSSSVISVTEYSDDVSGLASGTRVEYVVRVVGTGGREGTNGGDFSGASVEATIP
ncbi:MAG: carboxypeptidase regulatory-like domain-containing protein [Fibrobacteres bacterium]|nr:carboxypeptidase regulatory-like domain-containing protein [Fibrobacterota bacterium]